MAVSMSQLTLISYREMHMMATVPYVGPHFQMTTVFFVKIPQPLPFFTLRNN